MSRGLVLIEKASRCVWCDKPADVYDSGDRGIPSSPNGYGCTYQGGAIQLDTPVTYSPGLVAFCPGCADLFVNGGGYEVTG